MDLVVSEDPLRAAHTTADELKQEIDEREGRRAADRLDVSRLGLLGVLVEAKRAGHVPVLRPLLRSLRQDAGFWMSEALQDRVLEKVEEQ